VDPGAYRLLPTTGFASLAVVLTDASVEDVGVTVGGDVVGV